MKKLYFIFSLLLMFMGINTAYAGVQLGAPITDPSTLKSGDKIIMRADAPNNPDAEDPATFTYKFYASLADSLLYARTTIDAIDPYISMVLEDAASTINGKNAFYIKNEKNGKYLAYKFVEATEGEDDGSIYTDGAGEQVIEMYMTYTADKSKAFPMIITTATEGGTMMGYDGDPASEGALMFIGQCKEADGALIALNFVYDSPLVASYDDYATWWQVYKSEFVENYIADLAVLYEKIESVNFRGGTDPGCYDPTLVEAFDAAKEQARNAYDVAQQVEEDCKAAYLALEEAYLNLVTANYVALTEGYYRITTGYAAFAEQQDGAIKTMYGDNDKIVKWKNLDETDAKMVWKFIDRKDGTWLLYNVGTGTYVNAAEPAGLSANVTLRNDSTDCGVRVKYVDQSVFNLYAGTYAMHAGSHSSGAGQSGNIVGWDGGVNTASVWYINSIPAEDVDTFEQVGIQNMLNTQLKALYDVALAKYTVGSSYNIDTDTAHYLVKLQDFVDDPNVIYSNADHNTLNPSSLDGAGYAGLVDSDTTTYWHSTWGVAAEGQHYLQFVLNKEVEGVAVYLTLRKNQVNQATQLDFYVNEDTANADGWKKAGTIAGLNPSTDNTGNGLRIQTTGVSFDKAYKYVRVYLTSNSGFTHFTGFHLEEATLSETCQNKVLGEIATNLLTQLNNADALIAAGEATQEAIDALQAAYDAYVAELADPTALKAKLDSITRVANNAAVPSMHSSLTATTPGVYSEEAKTSLLATVAEVQAYIDANDAAGTYTKAAINENIQKLETALAAFKETLVFITDYENGGVWYKISASQHYYDMTGTAQDTHEGSNSIRKGQVYVNLIGDETTRMHNTARLNVTGDTLLSEMGVDADYGLWRFVNLADTAYAVQNKATGLYIGHNTSTGGVGLSMTPVAFKISEIGYATFILDGYRFDGTKTSPLHVQTNGQVLVFWNNYDLGNGSCFDIEATEEPATDAEQINLNIETVVKGKLYAKCYPVEIEYLADKSNSNAYPYQIATIDLAAKKMTLKKYEDVLEAGQPFFYIGGDNGLGVAENPTAADTTQMIAQINPEGPIAATPLTDNGLVGNYYNGIQVAKGFGVVRDFQGVQSIGATTANQAMGWNSAYIDATYVKNDAEPGTIEVPLTGNLLTSIEEAIIDAQTGNVNVYSIDGVLVKKNVKVSEATKGLAKGIYIVGNKKVAVQ